MYIKDPLETFTIIFLCIITLVLLRKDIIKEYFELPWPIHIIVWLGIVISFFGLCKVILINIIGLPK